MIFIILGTQKFQLKRLLNEIEVLIGKGFLKEEVIAQTGFTNFLSDNIKCFDYLDKNDFDKYISEADLIITHSGVGSIITAISYNKPVIVYPRLKKYKEHVDDHQKDIAIAFEKKGFVLCCNDGDDLENLIIKSKTYDFKKYVSGTDKIVGIIEGILDEGKGGKRW